MSLKSVLKFLAACVTLTGAIAAFLGFENVIPRLQGFQALLFGLFGLLAFFVLALVSGRLYCEVMCPLGILQTVVNWIFHPKTHVRRVCTRLPQTRTQQIVRGAFVVGFFALWACGLTGIAAMIEPWSLFGKAMTLFVPGLVVFGAVLVLAAVGKGRIWCNWVCPVGTVFSLCHHSLCRHQVGPGCGNCRKCHGEADGEKAEKAGEAKGPEDGLTRRETLQGIGVLAAAEALEKTTDGGYAAVSLPGVPKRMRPVLPPGVWSLDRFRRQCIGCGLCIANCPEHVLKPSVKLSSFGQPEMTFQKGYCRLSCNYNCGHVCPTGAIDWISRVSRKDVHMGRAVWNRDLCVRTAKGETCAACVRKCPVKAIHLVEGFPVVDDTVCIGCGACEHVCPSRPLPAISVEGYEEPRIVFPMHEAELVAEMKSVLAGGAAVVAAKDGVIVAQESGRGVRPLMTLLERGRLSGALVVDKVIGRAAAAICVAGGAKKVHGLLMSEDARAFLTAHGVEAEAEKLVPRILDRDRADRCPLEKAVDDLNEPTEMINALKRATEK